MDEDYYRERRYRDKVLLELMYLGGDERKADWDRISRAWMWNVSVEDAAKEELKQQRAKC